MKSTYGCCYSQILQNFIPVYKPGYLSAEFILCQISGTNECALEHKSFSIQLKSKTQISEGKILQNFQVWNLRQSRRDWTNQLIVFQNSEESRKFSRQSSDFSKRNEIAI